MDQKTTMDGKTYFQAIKKKLNAVAFDLDGVLLDSVNIKTEAFRCLFANKQEHVEKIIAYHLDNGGISRYLKFKYFYEEFFKEKYTAEVERELGTKFSEIVFEKVSQCRQIPYSAEFVQMVHVRYPLYIISGTPQEELDQIINSRQWNNYFKDVFGSPMTKNDALQRIAEKQKIKTQNILFFGDAMTDYKAAKENNSFFIGRAERGVSPFPLGTIVIDDFQCFFCED